MKKLILLAAVAASLLAINTIESHWRRGWGGWGYGPYSYGYGWPGYGYGSGLGIGFGFGGF